MIDFKKCASLCGLNPNDVLWHHVHGRVFDFVSKSKKKRCLIWQSGDECKLLADMKTYDHYEVLPVGDKTVIYVSIMSDNWGFSQTAYLYDENTGDKILDGKEKRVHRVERGIDKKVLFLYGATRDNLMKPDGKLVFEEKTGEMELRAVNFPGQLRTVCPSMRKNKLKDVQFYVAIKNPRGDEGNCYVNWVNKYGKIFFDGWVQISKYRILANMFMNSPTKVNEIIEFAK